ncbi:zinc ribbon domain-containing protein [Halorubrum sp. CBA1229]|uniref:zinc ribbon domain-containing protein n=1 Tax=Halorubrum sp. CBA1229 TaxID=1853699 RepID=UPI0020D13E9C|nr:zinc ribbon domain-containing protein [Halorubrum sp. CBA1229]
MKLSTRRTIRGWLLDLPDKTLLAALFAAGAVSVLGIVTETDSVFLGGVIAVLGVIYVNAEVPYDTCPNCRSKVNALGERYCPTCGARLDELEAAPPIDERVDERFRPLNLEEIERSPELEAIADGGEFGDEEVDR